MIYFDNSATTPIDPEVLEAMLPYLREEYGNPSSKYYTLAEHAKKAVEEARERVAKLLGCSPDEVIFTSGSTESNNMVLKGVADFYQAKGNRIVTTKAEHPSILETAGYLEQKDFQITYLDVDSNGRVDQEKLSSLLQDVAAKPILVSIIWGNNEVGSLNDINTISKLCEENGVFFHTDATQVVGKISIDISKTGVQFLSCSSHKLHGPKGVGACVIKKHRLGFKTKLTPLLHGGDQENGYRSGTLSVHNIVGFGKAAEIAYRDLQKTQETLTRLEEAFIQGIEKAFPNSVFFNSDRTGKIPGIINIRFDGVNNELLIRKLAEQVSVSTGSACSSSKPSHVLQSMGLGLEQIRSSIRISLSKFNTEAEIEQFIHELKK